MSEIAAFVGKEPANYRARLAGRTAHYVITPFNVPKFDHQDGAWQADRLYLVEQATVPSLIAQADKSFVWWAIDGPGLNEAAEIEFKKLTALAGGRTIELNDAEPTLEDVGPLIGDDWWGFGKPPERVATTILPPGVALNRGFIQQTHKIVEQETASRFIVDFVGGIVSLKAAEGDYLSPAAWDRGPVITVVEPYEQGCTLLTAAYPNVRNLFKQNNWPIVRVQTKRAWFMPVDEVPEGAVETKLDPAEFGLSGATAP